MSTSSATAVALRPRNSSSERPLRPSRSLSQPATSTETAPTAGKMALKPAARLMLNPRWSCRYTGVQVLKVSRIIVQAKDSRQTSRKARLRSSGSSSAPMPAGGASVRGEQVQRIRRSPADGPRRRGIRAAASRFATSVTAATSRGEQEQRPPAVAVLDQQPHLLARERIADQVADAEDADDRAVGGVVEPLGGHLDEPGPAERLRQAVADPGEREQRQAARQAEQQGEHARRRRRR